MNAAASDAATSLQPQAAAGAKAPGISVRRIVVALIMGGLLALALSYGLRVFSHSFMVETTDDAFTEGTVAPVSPKIAGRVQEVLIHENQEVKKGDLLVKLEDSDEKVKQSLQDAGLTNSRLTDEMIKMGVGVVNAQLDSANAQLTKAKADLDAAKATQDRAKADFERAKQLVATKAVSAQDLDANRAASIEADARYKSAQQGVEAAEASVKQNLALVEVVKAYQRSSEVKTQQSELDLKQAALNLGYTRILAPETGRVTRKGVDVGAYVQPGQNLMAIVTPKIWVVANFKEIQLEKMREGQQAMVRLDAHPDKTYRAHVDSIQAGSGARFSLFPPENATGNYVKVVQRVPVKIVFDEPLDPAIVAGPGLSVEPEVVIGKEMLPVLVQTTIAVVGGFLVMVLVLSRSKKTTGRLALPAHGR
jgi:membrane fusion protein (multidrug efflux system)